MGGVIIKMDSKELIKDFLPEIDSQEDFQYVLVSQFITTKDKLPNVKSIPILIPPHNIAQIFVNDGKKQFKKAYLNYLKIDKVEAFLSIIVKAVVINNLKMVLVCSKSEDDFGYLDLVCEYIEEVFGIKTYSMKKYLENPEKAGKIKNEDDIKKILNKKFEHMERVGVDLDVKPKKNNAEKQLKKMKRKELRKFAKSKKIKLDEDMDKDDMIKKILKKLSA